MIDQSAFKVGKGIELLTSTRRPHRTQPIKIGISPTPPGTLSHCKHGGVQMVVTNHIPLGRRKAVVPQSQDNPCYVVSAFRGIVNTTSIERHQIGKGIEMVEVMEFAVNSRNTRLCFSAVAPEVGHINLTHFILPSGVVGDDLFPLGANQGHHLRHKVRVGKGHFVGTQMQIGHIIEKVTRLSQQFTHDRHSLLALHRAAESALKGGAMARDINFRYQRHTMRPTEFNQLPGLLVRVEFSRHT